MNDYKIKTFLWNFYKKNNLFSCLEFDESIFKVDPSTISLEDSLMEQLRLESIDKKLNEICIFIIQNLDDKGFINLSNYDISKYMSVSNESVCKAIKLIESLDPCGIGSRNLKECLIIQSRKYKTLEKFSHEIWDNLLNMDFNKASSNLGVTVEEFKNLITPLRTFISYPRKNFGHQIARVNIPDIDIMEDLSVELSKSYRFKIESSFYKSNNYSKINDINIALEKRADTLLKIAEMIVLYQKKFFNGGDLISLNQSDIAEKLKIHRSTVSRACSDKTVLFNGRVYDLKFFFPNKLNSGISTHRVKNKIKEIIDSEDKKKLFSDEDIRRKLLDDNISISRRTISKYRNELGILSKKYRKCIK